MMLLRGGGGYDVTIEGGVMMLLWGGFSPKNPNPKWKSLVVLGFFHLRPTCFLHFFREISPVLVLTLRIFLTFGILILVKKISQDKF